ncbi:lipoyl domain-containing protein [Glutamicibacter protophormiae]|uniref:lipoyl domain-containing protein n=1 Tax=Glutamicibacter protophormiae TaxID=37930 RepID=UPI002A7F50A2|nr:lipoyl domain-containing protein [Glutamicibacter protophormiae]WPR65364.1 lipoyl domain-containing protein [Glutamicibacter protophormiae]WPR68861.1 lipoyl domain-containing protein [Glutamicibacter protophormiae]
MDVVVDEKILGSETEADISEWLVEEGSQVAEGQSLAELETSKVQVEVPAPMTGVVTFLAAEGDVIEPGAVIARIA